MGALCGVLYWLSFPGFNLWPLAFVALVPLMLATDLAKNPRTGLLAALVAGLVANQGRVWFLVETLANFSGFPWLVCALISLLLCTFQSGQFLLFVWLLQRIRARGLAFGLWAPVAFAATEFAYPRIFHDYLANALHDQPLCLQVVDLGGPGLLSAAVVLANAFIYEVLSRLRGAGPGPSGALVVTVLFTWSMLLGYGVYRMDEVGGRIKAADTMTIGLVQANAGMFDKGKERRKYYLRHYRSSKALEDEVAPDLLIWPETALHNVRDTAASHSGLKTPLLFGADVRRNVDGETHRYNSALLTDSAGSLIGTYDKYYLMPFGEYLPLGETFPILHEWSPRSGRFTAGARQDSLALGAWRIGVLICYEDMVPAFVRETMSQGQPHLLVNLTNDAWFGQTVAPWLHLGVAKFRAVEHHRYLARATNTGLTVVIDPLGRTVAQAEPFRRARIHARVARLEGQTVYGRFGDIPGPVSLLLVLGMLWRRPATGSRVRRLPPVRR